MTNDMLPDLTQGNLADRLYDIALDPEALETFIDLWNSAGLDAQSARQTMDDIAAFDDTYSSHLNRADTFLGRGEDEGPTLSALLAPFENLAAMIVDRALNVVACNAAATHYYDLKAGDNLVKLQVPQPDQDKLETAIGDLFNAAAKPDCLLKLETGPNAVQTLLQMRRLSKTADGGPMNALIVTTRHHWLPALGDTLEEVFQLTQAEQGIVRAMVEGHDVKSISKSRGTSEGTVRYQIKSILAKMNAKSQSEVIRLVLSLRDVTENVRSGNALHTRSMTGEDLDWLETEVWKPFKTLVLPDGRNLDYHDMGPATGAPVLFSHMGYCIVRWSRPMIKLAFQHGLRIICPIRAGYGQSTNIDWKDDVIASTREDTLALLAHLGIKRLPYMPQGNDLIFAVDLAAAKPGLISEIIGICARPYLKGDKHYARMGKWHRFFLSTGKHSPHLLHFTTKAVISMARKIGVVEMFRHANKDSAADMALTHDKVHGPVLAANTELIVGTKEGVAQAYTMELMTSEADWSDLVIAARDTPTWFVNGLEDPAYDVGTIADYRESYPWIDIEVVPNAGQMLIYQHFMDLIPRVAKCAKAAREK